MRRSLICITGCAGFIGSSLASKLLRRNFTIIGIDNFASNYPQKYKQENINLLLEYPNFYFHKVDILDKSKISNIFSKYLPKTVFHLAALTGVRQSLRQTKKYFENNVVGVKNIYQISKHANVEQFIFTSSSSVYGNSSLVPFEEKQILTPQSPYAKTKQQGEYVLQELYNTNRIPLIILRLFSVYGPKSRPDLAPYIFTKAAFHGKKIDQFGDGNSARDYTYIDDVLNALCVCLYQKSQFEILNIGNSHPIKLKDMIMHIEKYTGKIIKKQIKSSRSEEAIITYANNSKAYKTLKWQPKINFDSGIKQFIDWYKTTRLQQE